MYLIQDRYWMRCQPEGDALNLLVYLGVNLKL